MAVINHAKREINIKIVYYGPAGSGKASLFRYIHQRVKPSLCGPLKSMPAGGDELLFFDYLPFEHADLDGYQIRFHLYTLTGAVRNPGTWKMVLKGVDGLAVVVEAGLEQDTAAVQAVRTLHAMLAGHGRDLRQLAAVLISSKADLAAPAGGGWGPELAGIPAIESSTVTGGGVLQALAALTQDVVRQARAEQRQVSPAADQGGGGSESDPVAATPVFGHQPPVLDQQVPTMASAVVSTEATTTVQLPVTLQVGGTERHFLLRIVLSLEEVPGGAHCV